MAACLGDCVVAGFISFVQGIQNRLSVVNDYTEVGWVCVDQRPVKEALFSLANKWKHIYASYLIKRVCGYVKCNMMKYHGQCLV